MLLIPTLLCPKSWEKMSGDESQRFCTYCKKHVHNLESLSVSERLALFSSPAAAVCSRYQVAIRRAVPGQQESYARHLLKYGVGVALTGSVLLVLWEMPGFYRLASGTGQTAVPMPGKYYQEHRVKLLGDVYVPPQPPPHAGPAVGTPPHIDIQLDPVEVQRLIDLARPKIDPPDPVQPQI